MNMNDIANYLAPQSVKNMLAAQSAMPAPAAGSTPNMSLDGSEIGKGYGQTAGGQSNSMTQPLAAPAARPIGVDYNIFQGSADGATGTEGGGTAGTGGGSVGGTSGVGGNAAAGNDSGEGGGGGGYTGGPVSKLADGGPVYRDIPRVENQQMGQRLADQGTGRDTMLVHMSPAEVQGLGSLHPSGRMPINPRTGLPEADFLTDVLPGIAGTVIGSVVGMPWLGAAIGGLGTFAATGNLGKGILSGLMSFGLGQIGGALGEAGAEAGVTAAQGGTEAAKAAAATPLSEATRQIGTEQLAATGSGAAAPPGWVDPSSSGVLGQAGSKIQPQGFMDKISSGFQNAPTTLGNIGRGFANPQNLDFSKLMMPAAMAGSGAYGLYSANQQPASPPQPQMPQQMQAPPLTTAANPPRIPTGGVVPQGQNPQGYQGELQYFQPNPAWGGYPSYASHGGQQRSYQTPDGGSYELAKGGVAELPSGMIRGPGAGMDDKIKGTIDGRRDVYLSDGEYVVDAQTISALGDGSSEAGAKRMKGIVEDIRQKKFGSKKQPKKMAAMGGLASLGLAGGSDGNVDYGPEYLPATADDFTEAGMKDGKIEYKKRGPGYGKKELAKAREELKYMEDLTRRNAPLVLNERYAGKGMPDDNRDMLTVAPHKIMRGISQLTIGQPYGRFSPPYQSEVNEKRRAVEDAMINAREPGYEDILRRLYPSSR